MKVHFEHIKTTDESANTFRKAAYQDFGSKTSKVDVTVFVCCILFKIVSAYFRLNSVLHFQRSLFSRA